MLVKGTYLRMYNQRYFLHESLAIVKFVIVTTRGHVSGDVFGSLCNCEHLPCVVPPRLSNYGTSANLILDSIRLLRQAFIGYWVC
jgi:hypothetical protein